MVVAGGRPSKLALGATSGPVSLSNLISCQFLGRRTANVLVPRCRYSNFLFLHGKITLTGPGQNFFKSLFCSGVAAMPNLIKSAKEDIKIIRGFLGLRLRKR